MGPRCEAPHEASREAMEEALAELLRLSLAAWHIVGQVSRSGDRSLLVLAENKRIAVQRAPASLPFRWLVRAEKTRAAVSVIGVLHAVRIILDPRHRAPALLVSALPPVAPDSS